MKQARSAGRTPERRQVAPASLAATSDSRYEVTREAGQDARRKIGLLIGCGDYPALRAELQLRGPPNDVALIQELLLSDRFRFDSEQLRVLTSSGPNERLPTRELIRREFESLCQRVLPDDDVFVFLSGHGCRIPNQNPAEDPEPDGLDEAFVPMDLSRWDAPAGLDASELILDDELGSWLRRLESAGARVFFIADTCHAGSIDRGAEFDRTATRVRRLPPLPQASPSAEDRSPSSITAAGTEEIPRGVVSLFAVPANQAALEELMPPGKQSAEGTAGVVYGRLTYALTQVLSETQRPLSYRELLQQIQWKYAGWNWQPFPYLAGEETAREVLSQATMPERSRIQVVRKGDQFRLNVGFLSQITIGSIFAVFPQSGDEADDQAVGYLQVIKLTAGDCLAVPCSFENSVQPTLDGYPLKGRAELVYRELGDARLPVWLSFPQPLTPELKQRAEGLQALIARLAEDPKSLIRQANSPEEAELFVVAAADSVSLAQRNPLPEGNLSPKSSPRIPFEPREKFETQLSHRLTMAARAINLVRLASGVEVSDPANGSFRSGALQVELSVARSGTDLNRPDAFQQLPELADLKFQADDRVRLRIRNVGNLPLRVTGLMVESSDAIQALTPRIGGANQGNLINPGGTDYREFRIRIDDTCVGVDQFVLIAVPSSANEFGDFSYLAQRDPETFERGLRSANRGTDAISELLLWQLFGEPKTRGPARAGSAVILRIPWLVESK